MADKRRLNLSFSMAQPRQREAWNILSTIPAGQRTETVCRMILERQDQKRQTDLLQAVREIVREELLKSVRTVIQDELRQMHVCLNDSKEETCSEKEIRSENDRAEETGDVGNNVLGFLRSLQEEGDDRT